MNSMNLQITDPERFNIWYLTWYHMDLTDFLTNQLQKSQDLKENHDQWSMKRPYGSRARAMCPPKQETKHFQCGYTETHCYNRSSNEFLITSD